MSQRITKALIPAAGFGTRFLPQTKAMPKEMMPLVDKPIIQRVVEELVEAGIETIVIVTGWNKRSIEDHFDNNAELEFKLEQSGKEKELEIVRTISNMAEFVYLRQKGPMGNATPIQNARHIMRDDPFLMFWGDDFIDATPSRARQLLDAYEEYNSTIIGAMIKDKPEDYKKYGYVKGDEVKSGVLRVKTVIEKPGDRERSPSDLASLSGMVITSDIYKSLDKLEKTLKEGDELVTLDGIQGVVDSGVDVYAVEIRNGVYRDTGNKIEYLKTLIDYGLKHPEIGEEFEAFLKDRCKNF